MRRKTNPILQTVQIAIQRCTPLTTSEIHALREKSEKAVATCKAVFWAGIVMFNLALWFPLPFAIDRSVTLSIALLSLFLAIVLPVAGLRRHNRSLSLLETATQSPKRKTSNALGKTYIELVRKQGRPFLVAEFQLIEGSKWHDSPQGKR